METPVTLTFLSWKNIFLVRLGLLESRGVESFNTLTEGLLTLLSINIWNNPVNYSVPTLPSLSGGQAQS